MPAPVSPVIRQALWAASQQGLGTAALAERFHLPPRTVRHLLQLGRSHAGQIPDAAYHRVSPRDHAAAADVYHCALELKQRHPDWGARFLLGVLAKTLPGQPLPSERTLRRWLRQQHQPAAPPGRPASASPAASATTASTLAD